MAVLSRVRTKLRDLVPAMDAFALRAAHDFPTVFVWPLIYAVVNGATFFLMRHTSWLPLIDTNKVPAADSYTMAWWGGASIIAMWLFYALVLLVQRLRKGSSGGVATFAAVNRRLRITLALPLIPALMRTGIERDGPRETHFLIVLAALAAGAGVYAWMKPTAPLDTGDPSDAPPPRRPILEGVSRALAGLTVAGLWAAYGGFFSWLSVQNHHSLHTRTTDLGYYDNIFWNSAHGRPLACSFIRAGYHGSAHFDPLLVLLSPIYLLHPHAETLLVLQSVWLGAGVVPLYLLARHKLGERLPAVMIAATYALYPALQGANMYEFHSLTLLSPLLLTLLYFLEKESLRGYFITLVPTLLVREDVALLMCFVGAYAIYTRRPKMVRAGWITVAASLVYFIIVKRFFMTSADIFMSGKDAYSFAYYYEDLIPNRNGTGGLVISLLTNPVFVLRTLIAEPKISYLLVLFVPVLFLPFVAKPGRVMLLYGLLFSLLASRPAVYSPHFQYSATLLPIAFALTPEALRQIRDGRLEGTLALDGARISRALVFSVFVASVLVSWKFGGLVENQSFRGGFNRVARSMGDKEHETYAWIREQARSIPLRAAVGTTNRLGAHVSNRKTAYFYPEHQNVDYLFLDEGEIKGPDLEKHNKILANGTFLLVARRDKLVLYKRAPKEKDL